MVRVHDRYLTCLQRLFSSPHAQDREFPSEYNIHGALQEASPIIEVDERGGAYNDTWIFLDLSDHWCTP